MPECLAPLDQEPVSVHAPFISYPGGQYHHEYPEKRRAALVAALDGVDLGAFDRRVLHWLAWWDVAIAASVVSLMWRARNAATQQAHRGGGEPR
jgi:hypothetical protein